MARITIPLVGIVLVACAGDGTGLDDDMMDDMTNDMTGVSLSEDVQPILSANCALSGCHAGTSPQLGQNLSAGQTFANVVNVPSVEVPSLMRVRPSKPDSSYLVHKIQGTQGTVGGTGEQMPLGVEPLSNAEIDLIRTWIAEGAEDN